MALSPWTFGPDLGPDRDLTWDLDLDLSLTIMKAIILFLLNYLGALGSSVPAVASFFRAPNFESLSSWTFALKRGNV